MFDHSFPACAFFFFKWRLACAHWFHSLRQDRFTMAQRAVTTEAACSLTSCVWARLLIGCLDSGIVSPLRHHCVKGVCVFRCNLQPALLAEWQGLLRATAVTRRWIGKQISQYSKLTLEKKIPQSLLPGFEFATFRSRVRRSTNEISRMSCSTLITPAERLLQYPV